jgi:lipopolysaccharide transport system ATP-binding protein
MSSKSAINLQGLSKCYYIYERPEDRLKKMVLPRLQKAVGLKPRAYGKEFWAVKNLSFEIKKGETVGIVGRNGSGKSTILQMICGTVNPTCGKIEVQGRIAALLELGSGFNPEFTGRENVYLNGSVLGMAKEEIDSKLDAILTFADIGDFINQPIKTYSSGMVVRLAFAVAINADPQILIIDEALSVGDELFQRKCFSRIEEIKKNGATILFVSHSAQTVIELCDSVKLIDGGELIAEGQPKTIVGMYHKLLYAPLEKREEIRGGIKSLAEGTFETNSAFLAELDSPDVEDLESYDPNFLSQSILCYESRGALISEIKIQTLSGKKVNTLVAGRRYKYSYKTDFHKSVTNVRFGMLVKTSSGYELAGFATEQFPLRSPLYFLAGQTIRIEFEFTCCFNVGTYFLNAGVLGCENGEEVYLHRIIDGLSFRSVKLNSIINLDSGPIIAGITHNLKGSNNDSSI